MVLIWKRQKKILKNFHQNINHVAYTTAVEINFNDSIAVQKCGHILSDEWLCQELFLI